LLRRFRYGDATSVATYAAEKTIGKSWRLVTLDDASAAPVGVSAARRRLLRGVGGLGSSMERADRLIDGRALGVVAILPLVIAGVAAVKTEVEGGGGSADPYVDIFRELASGHVPLDAVTPSLVGAFAVSIFALALALVGVALFLAWAVILMLLIGVIASAESASEAAESAEQSKELSIENAGEIHVAVNALAAQSRMVLAPRLVVVRVASSVWQPTVKRLATAAPLTIVDVSESTENLLWEIRELRDRLGPRCVFVGERTRVARLTDPMSGSSPVPALDAELSHLLDGREVLAYTTDARGKRRFARALRSKLLEAAMDAVGAPAPAPGEAPAWAQHRRGLSPDKLALHELCAQAMVDKGFKLAESGRHEKALAVHASIVARYGDADEPVLRERVAEALVNNGVVLAALGRFDDELCVYDDIVIRFGEDVAPGLRERVADALVEKAITLAELDRPQQALATCDDIVARYGDTSEPALRARVARALVSKAATLREAGRAEETLAVNEDVVDRHERSPNPGLREQVAAAHVNRGRVPDTTEHLSDRVT